MRIKTLSGVLFLWSCIVCSQQQVDANQADVHTIKTQANAYLSTLTALGDFNGVVLLKKGEDVVLKNAYTMQADTTATLFVKETTQFDLRSIAKLFAKLSVLQLEAEGKLSREDKLSTWLPDFPNGEKITVHHLMTNTSGLPRSFETATQAYLTMEPEEVVALASKASLEFEPGTSELYSNVGFQLLYYLIGKVTHSGFESYIDRQFFQVLGMQHSGSHFYEGKHRKQDYAYGHYEKEGELICECAFPEDDMKMGNLFSTVTDLSRLLAYLDKTKHQDLLHENRITHAGGTRGKRAYVERNFAEDYSIIFLSNYDGIPFEQMIKDLRLILENKEVVMPKAIHRKATTVPAERLRRFVGTYDLTDAGHIMLSIKLEEGQLYVYQKGKNNGVLFAESETVFFSDPTSKESIAFVKNTAGTYDMLIDFQGVQWKGTRVIDTPQ